MTRSSYPDDPDITIPLSPKAQIDTTPLFAPLGWPESPPAPAEEQQVLPIRKATIEGDYRAWLTTVDGERVLHEFCKQALEDLEAGQRLSAKLIWELVRRKLRVDMNNDFTPLAARDCELKHPTTAGLFEKRKRKTA